MHSIRLGMPCTVFIALHELCLVKMVSLVGYLFRFPITISFNGIHSFLFFCPGSVIIVHLSKRVLWTAVHFMFLFLILSSCLQHLISYRLMGSSWWRRWTELSCLVSPLIFTVLVGQFTLMYILKMNMIVISYASNGDGMLKATNEIGAAEKLLLWTKVAQIRLWLLILL